MPNIRTGLLLGLAGLIASCGERRNDEPADGPANMVVEANATAPATAGGANAAQPSAVSQFTSVADKDCRTIEQTSEEGGFYRGLCPGAGGYQVEVTEGDLRQNLTLIDGGGARHSLDLNRLGSGFSEIGDTLEWRGPAGAPPRTLTLRFNVYRGAEAEERPTSYLAVARLEGVPCVVARVAPGPSQSDEARRIADAETLPGCWNG